MTALCVFWVCMCLHVCMLASVCVNPPPPTSMVTDARLRIREAQEGWVGRWDASAARLDSAVAASEWCSVRIRTCQSVQTCVQMHLHIWAYVRACLYLCEEAQTRTCYRGSVTTPLKKSTVPEPQRDRWGSGAAALTTS